MKTNRDRKPNRIVRYALLLAAAVFSSMIYVSAADANVFLQSYESEEDRVIVYCTSMESTGENYDPQQFTATISGQDCPVLDVSTVGQEQEGITYYCLVDVSGSMHQEQMAHAKDVLTKICESLGENDNMVIGALGTTLETTDFLKDKDEIRKVIDGLTGESDYTAIYDAMVDSISVLKSNNSCNMKKCLVLISDGDDETVLGTTRDEALSAVTDSDIPVYTVATMRQSPTAQQKEAAENLGAFARSSVGGKDYPPVGNDYASVAGAFDADEAGGFIVEDMQSGIILTLDTSGIETAKDEVLLNVTLKTDSATYSDTMYLYAADLKFSSKEPETEPNSEAETKSETEPEPETEPETESESESISVYLIAAGAVLILIILTVVILVIKRNKVKKEKAEREAAEKEEAQKEEELRKERQKAQPPDMTVFHPSSAAPEPFYEVKFMAIDHENVVFILHIPEERTVTIGRNQKADLVLNPNDKHLSSIQCKVRCMQNAMNIWDMNSQNGTFVNGVPIRQIGMATAQNNDVIRMGSYEYRINIMQRRNHGKEEK